MSEYEKLTVIKLRDELVKRGLPKTGLKAVLVQRLEEADAQTGSVESAPVEPAKETQPEPTQEKGTVIQEPQAPSFSHEDARSEGLASAKHDAPTIPRPEPEVVEASGQAEKDEDIKVVEGATEHEQKASNATQNGVHMAQSAMDRSPEKVDQPESLMATPSSDHCSKGDMLPGASTQLAQEPQLDVPSHIPAQTQSQSNTMLSRVGTEEILEDSRKRKRRSQSPPPSSIDTQKRLKADHGKPRVELPEDSVSSGDKPNRQLDDVTVLRTTSDEDRIVEQNGHVDSREGNVTPKQNGVEPGDAAPTAQPEVAVTTQVKAAESPAKPSPSDTRFKGLFTAPSKSNSSAKQPPYSDTEDRVISPAIHPATSALYIRELMRPLKPENVKDHLAALATPPDSPTDSNTVTDFFLDSIRTHCLVGFANISAASRVRSGLHDRIWPNERDRRPLFVDFVPEEKLKKWIDVEQNAPSGRGNPQKRWEVVYEDENGDIKAYLQEVGSSSGGLRAAQLPKAGTVQGVQGAPSGPKFKDSEPRSSQSRPDNAKGFQALDDLFKSTNAKPKLYFQPVPKGTADRRLERLASGRGGGRNDEMRRYTFEDSALVDSAPEFGGRGRGYGGRGGFSGSFRGRGGGYRGDGHRGGGDSWRDSRSGY